MTLGTIIVGVAVGTIIAGIVLMALMLVFYTPLSKMFVKKAMKAIDVDMDD